MAKIQPNLCLKAPSFSQIMLYFRYDSILLKKNFLLPLLITIIVSSNLVRDTKTAEKHRVFPSALGIFCSSVKPVMFTI